jgi:hypothetical protein
MLRDPSPWLALTDAVLVHGMAKMRSDGSVIAFFLLPEDAGEGNGTGIAAAVAAVCVEGDRCVVSASASGLSGAATFSYCVWGELQCKQRNFYSWPVL